MTRPILVLGAGTMGAGIAQVAAAAGREVLLADSTVGAAQAAVERIAAILDVLVSRDRMTAAEREESIARIVPLAAIERARTAELAIEAIVEDLDAKRAAIAQLEAVLSDDAIIASNTSSLSITALARDAQRPGRIVGMHFFNPVPVMRLVEVVSGLATDPAAATRVAGWATDWGKTPVLTRSTPGFIVNRIARPFYAEALALLQAGATDPATLDALAEGAGFRMGPCALMDLIGHDVNFAVTRSVFDANFGDGRYRPSLAQQALIDSGRLGRKSGRGFYEYAPGTARPTVAPLDPVAPAKARVVVHGDDIAAEAIRTTLATRGVAFDADRESPWTGLAWGDVRAVRCDGRTAMQCSADFGHRNVAVFDWAVRDGGALAIAVSDVARPDTAAKAAAALALMGHPVHRIDDVPGLWAARTLAMLVNEAEDAVQQGVCDESDADLAMKLGTNWPHGPFDWLARLGAGPIVTLLQSLHSVYGGDRYRVSPRLARRALAAGIRA